MSLLNNVRRAVTCAAMAASFFGAAPVIARSIIIDAYPEAVSLCTLGNATSCSALSSALGDVYVYDTGVVSFGGMLSDDASVGGGKSSFGGGLWFAPGFSGTTFQALAVNTNSYSSDGEWGLAINFYAQGVDVVGPDAFGGTGTIPLFQVQILPIDIYDNGTQVAFAYTGSPGAGATIAYNAPNLSDCTYDDEGNATCGNWQDSVVNNNGLNLNSSEFVVNFDPYSTNVTGSGKFSIVRDAVPSSDAPEPATWATLVLGFGVIGGALRRRRHTRALA